MQGAQQVHFGVPDVRQGGQVVAVGEDELVDVSEEEWDEAASVGADTTMLEAGRPGTPGGKEAGNLLWMRKVMDNLVAEALGEVDLRVMPEEYWERILSGDGVEEALKVEILDIFLEEEGYEVDEVRRAELGAVAGERAAYCWAE